MLIPLGFVKLEDWIGGWHHALFGLILHFVLSNLDQRGENILSNQRIEACLALTNLVLECPWYLCVTTHWNLFSPSNRDRHVCTAQLEGRHGSICYQFFTAGTWAKDWVVFRSISSSWRKTNSITRNWNSSQSFRINTWLELITVDVFDVFHLFVSRILSILYPGSKKWGFWRLWVDTTSRAVAPRRIESLRHSHWGSWDAWLQGSSLGWHDV